MCKKTILLFALAACLVLTSAAPGGEFNPTDDTWVDEANPTTNYNHQDTVRLRTTDKFGYYKFVVSGTSGTVTSAILKLHTVDQPIDDTSVYAVTGDWSESTLTWNNDDLVWGDLLETKYNVSAQTWYEFDVTSAVSGDGTYTFGLSTTMGAADLRWYTKEADYVPLLTVVAE